MRPEVFWRSFMVAASLVVLVVAGCGDSTSADDGIKSSIDGKGGGNVGDVGIGEGDAGGAADVAGDDAGGTDGGSEGTDAADATDAGDAGGDDVPTDDGGDGTEADSIDGGTIPDNCPGGANCGCAENADCDAGVCLDTADGKKCAKTCVDTCPKGFACKQFGATDGLFVCVPGYTSLCAPCDKDEDCNVDGNGALCLDHGAQGSFCGGACKADADCPDTHACVEVKSKGGTIAKQCKRKDDTIACGCTKWAITVGNKTTCTTANDLGTCSGTRTCLASGLSPCSASIPVVETCNDTDDDCDGETDNLPKTVTCTVATYLDEGSKQACKEGADCPFGEGCKAGICKTLIGACPGTPKCGLGGKIECTGAKTPKPEQCNGEDDNCDGQVDESYQFTDPGTGQALDVGASCGVGACTGGKVVCETLLKATCSTITKVATESCDGADNDCNGETDDEACDDGDQCTTDICDGEAAKCKHEAGAACDDTNQCTQDACDTKSGKCVFSAMDGPCDDGDACTVGDKCTGDGAGGATCSPGPDPKLCDDTNVCTDDSCDKEKGCVNLANSVTQSCYGGDPKTSGTGTCKSGVRYCADGKLLAACQDQVTPNKTEACDGKDDDCDGVTDNGCGAVGGQVSFSNAFGRVQGKGADGKEKIAWLMLGGGEPAGQAASENWTWWAGFTAWLAGVFGG